MDPMVLDISIPAIINIITIKVFSVFYNYAAIFLTDQENHQSSHAYETYFIAKRFTLSFVSYNGPMLFIQYLNEKIGLKCSNNDCYSHSKYHFMTIFLCDMISNFLVMLFSMARDYIQNLKNEPPTEK
jgi:Calcium-activated chloride channel